MERHITFTGETGETVTCSVYDVEDTLAAWYPEAPAEITDAIGRLEHELRSQRYPETSELDAHLALSWEWARPQELREAAEHLGMAYSTIRGYRSTDPSFPTPDISLGQSDGWWATTLDAWQAQRPGRGAGGGRPRKGA